MEGPTIKIKLIRSVICCPEKHKIIVRSLGLKKINQIVVRPDSDSFVSVFLGIVDPELRVRGVAVVHDNDGYAVRGDDVLARRVPRPP